MTHNIRSLAIAFLVLATLPAAGQDKAKTDVPKEKLDKKVVDIVKEVGKLYKDAKHLHAEAVIDSKIENGDEKREIKATAVFDVEKPNHLSMKTKIDGDVTKGPDVIADGKHLIIHRKAIKEYVERDLPNGLGEIGLVLLRLGKVNSGMLFGNILADDPGALLMDGVTSCSYVGKDKVDGTPVHRMKFTQENFDWELWVAAEGKPLVLRMVSIGEGPNGKVTTTETYKNWKLDAPAVKDTFKFTPPKDAKKVEQFSP